MLNVVKYSIIDLAPWLENRLYHYLKLVPEEDEGNEDDWEREEEPFFSLKHLEKYGLSFTSYMLLPPICVDTLSVCENLNLYTRAFSTLLACLLYVPIDVITTQMVLNPSAYPGGILDCVREIWRAEGWRVRSLFTSSSFPLG